MSDTPEPTLFEKIADGRIPSFKVWEDDNYVAFLTPWPSALGFTVVTPRKNPGGNFLTVSDDAYTGLLLAAKKVALLLQKALNVERVGLVIEGEGVPHLHVKLIPMHGKLGERIHQLPKHQEFYEEYPGWLSTAGGPAMPEEQLAQIQAKIKKAAEQ